MIVPMKKVAIITQAKDAESAIKSLRSLGVVHVEHVQLPRGKDINVIQDDLALLDQALEVISEAEFATGCEGSLARRDIADWKTACHHIIDAWKRLDQLQEYSRELSLKISEWEPWGDFEPGVVHELSQKNIYVRLFLVPVKELGNFPKEALVEKIFTKGNIAYCAVFSRLNFECAFKEVELPRMSISHMKKRIAEDRRIIESLSDDLKSLFCYQPKLLEKKKSLKKELEFYEILGGMGEAGSLNYLVGYAPFDAQQPLMHLAKSQNWGIYISDPAAEDNVPTFIRNPRWVSFISPVFKMIEIVPGYHELDISLWFLVFLSIFFGMLIGDAGYGLIYFLLTFFAQKKWGRKLPDKGTFSLFYILSSCAIIWGLLSGTFFGQEWLPGAIKPLAPALRNNRNVQIICFFLGALHLSIAHIWRLVLKLPSMKAFVDGGWLLVLWGVFFLAKTLILGDAFASFAKWLFIAGIALVIFFTNPQKNILKAFGAGLANLLLSLVNNFTDVVSYIRLFAVGLATVAVADAFNKMALDVGFGSIASGLVSSLILFTGHGLNIVLGPMSVLVHGVRLNILEFSSHADVKWSGFIYRPLRKEA